MTKKTESKIFRLVCFHSTLHSGTRLDLSQKNECSTLGTKCVGYYKNKPEKDTVRQGHYSQAKLEWME